MNKLRFLVTFFSFHPDNMQGGSGKHLEQKVLIPIDGDRKIWEIEDTILREVERRKSLPFVHVASECVSVITSVELLLESK